MPKPLFPLGQVVATPGALELGVNFCPYLRHHQCGDWGDLEAEDKALRHLYGDPAVSNGCSTPIPYRKPAMYHTHPPKARAVTRCLAVSRAHVGCFDFQPEATGRTRPSTIYYLSQEVTMLVLPATKEKAAVAAAASGAQESALLSNPIVPLLRRITMGFGSFPPTNSLLTPSNIQSFPFGCIALNPVTN